MKLKTFFVIGFFLGFFVFHPRHTFATTTYGTLDNFDVVNDTGTETHGFEIELEGITQSDVAYTFGSPYERYGDPVITKTSSGSVIVRYAASYDTNSHTWTTGTPTVASLPPTDGHSCWTYGDPAYPNVGCDHFGLSLNAVPTKTTYRWLVEVSPGVLGAFGSNVSLPAPVWNVTPPADPAAQPVAAVAIAPPVSTDPTKCGEALWAKVYTTELPNPLDGEDLNHMVVDDPVTDIVPNEPTEVEFEWVLLQSCPNSSGEQEFGGGAEVGAGMESVSRRFEFYEYTGVYDPDPEAVSQALCDNPLAPDQQVPERCGDPVNGIAGVGAFAGAQNAAVNLAGRFNNVNQNTPPVAADDTGYTATEDTGLVIPAASGVLVNDSDADGDPLTALPVTSPLHGTLTLNSDGSFGYLPDTHYSGTDTFTYVADDGMDISNVATVTLTVTHTNGIPVAHPVNVSTPVNTRVKIYLSATDPDVPADPLSYFIPNSPMHGTFTEMDGYGTWVLYEPYLDYQGLDSFEFYVNDGTVNSNTATVTITVGSANNQLAAANDAYTATEDLNYSVLSPGVLANDTSSVGISSVLVTGTAHGTITLNADGSFLYEPDPDFNGSDSFTYRAFDGSNYSNIATVMITVTPVNDKPVAVAGPDQTVIFHDPVTLDGSGSSDIDGDNLTFTWSLLNAPAHSKIQLDSAGAVTPTFTADKEGVYTFRLTVWDGMVSDTDDVTVTATKKNK